MNELAKIESNYENIIYEIRGKQVMLDSDIARIFNYEVKNLNRQVQRNINRFPENYCFQLTTEEYEFLRCQIGTLKTGRGAHRKYLPYVFTEHGITMLAGILKSDIAIEASLRIVNTFIAMRKYISNNLIEQKYINNLVLKDSKRIDLLEGSLSKFEEKKKINEIYFNGQIYDAYSKLIDIMKEAENELIIIDAYADKTVLDMISKMDVKVILIVKTKTLLSKLDIKKYNEQYRNLEIVYSDIFHDRYIILDNDKVYHCGTSLNRAGNKTFSINLLEDIMLKRALLNKVFNLEKICD